MKLCILYDQQPSKIIKITYKKRKQLSESDSLILQQLKCSSWGFPAVTSHRREIMENPVDMKSFGSRRLPQSGAEYMIDESHGSAVLLEMCFLMLACVSAHTKRGVPRCLMRLWSKLLRHFRSLRVRREDAGNNREDPQYSELIREGPVLTHRCSRNISYYGFCCI